MSQPDPLAAVLAEIRATVNYTMPRQNIARLMAAVDAVLDLPGKWADADEGLPSSALTEDRAWVRAKCAADLRAAILAALTGEGADGAIQTAG